MRGMLQERSRDFLFHVSKSLLMHLGASIQNGRREGEAHVRRGRRLSNQGIHDAP